MTESHEITTSTARRAGLSQPQLVVAGALVSLALVALAVFLYDRLLAPRPRAIAVVSFQAVLEAKEAQFSDVVARPGVSDAERQKAVDAIDSLVSNLGPTIAALAADCNCIVLVKEAVVGSADIDLTPQLIGKLGLGDVNVAEIRAPPAPRDSAFTRVRAEQRSVQAMTTNSPPDVRLTALGGCTKPRAYVRQLCAEIARMWPWWVFPLLAALVVSHFVCVSVNVTKSLPERLFIVFKQAREFRRGDYVLFRHPGGGPYPAGAPFVKVVAGVPGDLVEARGRDYYVNGIFIGRAKETSRSGFPLLAGPTGVIPAGSFFVFTPHPDSFDSRYALTGWVKQSQIAGRAVPVF